MKTVLLQTAFAWTCPECGNRNLCEGISADLSQEEREQMTKSAMGLDSWQEVPEGESGEFIMVPNQVQCRCGEWFKTEEPSLGEY